jgi:hypothetical protein
MEFSPHELSVLEDTDFLLTKQVVTKKLQQLLNKARLELKSVIEKDGFPFPEKMDLTTGKVSRGENYQGLPYMVLDFPKLFTKEDIFAYRTMFWWGHFFSSTLHLQGKYLEDYRQNLAENIDALLDKDIYISIGETPWKYHYDNTNYVPITSEHKEHILECNFLKLSKKTPVNDWVSIPGFATEYFEFLLSVLSK